MTVKVYGKAIGCIQCDRTKVALDKRETPYEFIDVTEDEEAFAYIIGLGYQQVPVVEYKGEHWSGYRPDKIQGLGNIRKEA